MIFSAKRRVIMNGDQMMAGAQHHHLRFLKRGKYVISKMWAGTARTTSCVTEY